MLAEAGRDPARPEAVEIKPSQRPEYFPQKRQGASSGQTEAVQVNRRQQYARHKTDSAHRDIHQQQNKKFKSRQPVSQGLAPPFLSAMNRLCGSASESRRPPV